MSEDRTQEPSKRRRILAREQGQVARSGELTGAATLLAATALLGVWGDDLALSLVHLVREPFAGDLLISSTAADVVERVRAAAVAVLGPLGLIVGGAAVAGVAAHQAQVGGLFLPGRLAPDFTRVWRFGGEGDDGFGLAERSGRGIWALVKAMVVLGVAAWTIRSGLARWMALGGFEPAAMARASGAILRTSALTMAGATLVLGLVDFAIQHQRLEAMLRLTPEEHREDLRAADGDPALRSRRRKQARALMGDAPELFAGAALVVLGEGGLIVVLAGGPPPRRVTIRSSARGATGRSLRRSAEQAGVASVVAPDLALALARLREPVVPDDLLAKLASEWA
jgi:flagellar biosynthetic protein FlhB